MQLLQSGTAKKCVDIVKIVISHSDELSNLRAVQVQTPFLGVAAFILQFCGLSCSQSLILHL